MDETKKEKLLTLPNILTLLRILFTPVFLVMMIKRRPFESLLVFSVAGITDVLDGFAARTWHLKSKLGTLLDPAADKLLMTVSYVLITIPGLNSPYAVPLWLTTAVIGRDLIILLGALLAFKLRGHKSFPPSLLGKISTVCQVALVFLVLLANYALTSAAGWNAALSRLLTPAVLDWAYGVTFVTTLLSWIGYGVIGFGYLFPRKGKPETITNSYR